MGLKKVGLMMFSKKVLRLSMHSIRTPGVHKRSAKKFGRKFGTMVGLRLVFKKRSDED